MTGLVHAVLGALLLAALNTFGDFVWARFIPRHRAVLGLLHGALLFLALGGYLGALRGRILRGALAGAGVGLAAALCYYALARWLRWYAMFPAWMALWAGFALLDARGLREHRASYASGLLRGGLAALGSGAAFYLISGIWIRPRPGGPDYLEHFLSWTVAFLPGFLALLLSVGAKREETRVTNA
jgi:hypothetical protein